MRIPYRVYIPLAITLTLTGELAERTILKGWDFLLHIS